MSGEKDWLVYTTDEPGVGGVYLWWKPHACGYTRYVEDAGRYTLEEAKRHAAKGQSNGAVPVDIVRQYIKSVLPIGALHETLTPGVHGAPS